MAPSPDDTRSRERQCPDDCVVDGLALEGLDDRTEVVEQVDLVGHETATG